MAETNPAPAGELVIKPCGRAFFVYYVAIVIFLLGPRINPDVWIFGVFQFSVEIGMILGLLMLAGVVYLKLGQEYRITNRGVVKIWRWPSPRQQEITWQNLGEVLVRRGMTQSMLRVGNLLFKDKSGGPDMFWFGLDNPKEIKDAIERRRP